MGQSAETKRAIQEKDWFTVSRIFKLDDEKFIKENIEYLSFSMISERDDLTIPFLKKYQYKLDWGRIIKNKKLIIPLEQLLENFHDYIRLGDLVQDRKLSESYISKNFRKFNSIQLLKYQNLSQDTIHEHWASLNKETMLRYQKITDREINRILESGDYGIDQCGTLIFHHNPESFYNCKSLWGFFIQHWVKHKSIEDCIKVVSKTLDFSKIHQCGKMVTHDLIELDNELFSVNFSKNRIFPDNPTVDTLEILSRYRIL